MSGRLAAGLTLSVESAGVSVRNHNYADRVGATMPGKRRPSSKSTRRKTLDKRVEDLRKKILYLDPYSGWFPAGGSKRIMNIVDRDLEPVGELETGSDGFVLLTVLVGRRLVRILYHPGQAHASVSWITLDRTGEIPAVSNRKSK